MAVPRINWVDRTPVILLKLTSICSAIPVFCICWIAFIWLTFCRFHDARLAARMDLVAEVLATTSPNAAAAKPIAAAILDKAKTGGRTKVKLDWQQNDLPPSTLPSSAPTTQLDSEFIDAAADVMALKDDDPALLDLYQKLGEMGGRLNDVPRYRRQLSDGSETTRPSLSERVFQDYFIFEGVNFRMPSDFAEARKSAKLYLKYRNSNFGAGHFNWVFFIRPWGILRFYDAKRVLLNDTLPFLLAELILVAGFFLRYRYYDTEFVRTKQIRQRVLKWVPLWEEEIAPSTWQPMRFGWPWILYIGAAILGCEALELITNDPEIAAERWINIPMMAVVGACLSCGIPALFSVALSEFSRAFRRHHPSLKSRVLRPFITAVIGWVAICVFIAYFSYDQLILRGNLDMRERGYLQLVFCSLGALLAIASVAFYLIPAILEDGARAGPPAADLKDFNAPEPPWCMRLLSEKIDEKQIISIALLLLPMGKVILGVVTA